MTTVPLPNYIRRHRKRACLTQEEVAFLLGTKSSASISRHERFKQTPDLQTLFAYEILFQTPVRNLFSSTREKVDRKIKNRMRLLIQKLMQSGSHGRIRKKIEMLIACLGEHVTLAKSHG